MDILEFGTPFGLAFASGLNAYFPLLAYAISVRWLHLYKVNPNFAFITQNWCIALLIVLTILDFVADKIPFIDHGWNAIHTVVRPIAGAGVAAAASSSGLTIPHTTTATTAVLPHAPSAQSEARLVAFSVLSFTGIGLLIILVIGGALAFLSHVAKSTTRIVSTIATAGILNIGLSVAENILAFILILLSLFASSIMFVVLVLLVLFLVPRVVRTRNGLFRRDRCI